jgi:hypothetical protein
MAVNVFFGINSHLPLRLVNPRTLNSAVPNSQTAAGMGTADILEIPVSDVISISQAWHPPVLPAIENNPPDCTGLANAR